MMGPLGCLAFDQCLDGPMPMMWQCTLGASSIPVEVAGSVYMAALPSAKIGQCVQVQITAQAVCLYLHLGIPADLTLGIFMGAGAFAFITGRPIAKPGQGQLAAEDCLPVAICLSRPAPMCSG